MNNILEHKIYLLKTCYVEENSAIPVYKIGRTCQSNLKRFEDYPKNFKLIYLRTCKKN